jgi:hypothetical protein
VLFRRDAERCWSEVLEQRRMATPGARCSGRDSLRPPL